MIKGILTALAILFIAVFAVALIVPRVMGDDPARWHADPRNVEPPDTPNSYLVADHDAVTLPMSPDEALSEIDSIAMAQARVTRLAKTDDGRVTYIQRSAVFAFPDYISVSVEPDESGSRISIYSRSRYGHSDLGVNKARIEHWLSKLENNNDAN